MVLLLSEVENAGWEWLLVAPRYRLNPDVIWVERPDGSSRLIHLDRNICGLDSSSTLLLHAILQDGAEGATQALTARSSRDPAVVRGEVEDFLGQLAGVAAHPRPTADARRPGAAAPRRSALPAAGSK